MKKIGLICLALVLALGALGVGAALWMGFLGIHGDVLTGNVEAMWSIDGAYDNEEKDVSFIDAVMMSPWDMFIMIDNAYPSVTYTVDWNIMCTGTVPIHFVEPMIMWELPPPLPEEPPPLEPGEITFTDVDGNPINWSAVQLHPGEIIYGKVTVHLNNIAEQGSIYMFDIVLPFGQYNEFPPLPPV